MAKKKAPKKTAPAAPQLSPEEARLAGRYPQRMIKPGSYAVAGSFQELDGGKKATLIILCDACGAERRVCVQDLFQVGKCRDCKKASKKAAPAKADVTARRYDVTHNGNDLDLPYAELLNLVTHGETVLLSGTGRRVVQLEAGSYTVFDVPNDKEYGPYRDAAQAVKKAVSG